MKLTSAEKQVLRKIGKASWSIRIARLMESGLTPKQALQQLTTLNRTAGRKNLPASSGTAVINMPPLPSVDAARDEWAVYTIRNKITGEYYHGQTRGDVYLRFRKHLKDAENGTTKLHGAIRQYGAESFELAGWIAVGKRHRKGKTLDKLEAGLIKLTESISEGYNIRKGGRRKVEL